MQSHPAQNQLSHEMWRKRLGQIAHYAIKPLGYLEFSEIYCIDLAQLPPARPLPEGYQFGRATWEDIDYIAENLVRDEPPEVIRYLWAGGHTCFVARRENRVVGYNWIALSDVQEEEYAVELNSAHAFCLNAYTAPGHRGRGIHYVLLRNMLEFAKASGRTKAFTLVSLFNSDSWKSHIRMGWQRAFTHCYFRPYFTLSRLPWALTKAQYPTRLDWQKHSWKTKSGAAHAR